MMDERVSDSVKTNKQNQKTEEKNKSHTLLLCFQNYGLWNRYQLHLVTWIDEVFKISIRRKRGY